jgi:hypothetical protein
MSDASVVASSPVTRRVRAYFAPVNRATGAAAIFDAAANGGFDLDAPPAPWLDLGWVKDFARGVATKIEPLRAGAPAVTQVQVRSEIDATVALEFVTWGKLQCALASGAQSMNLLQVASGAAAAGSGGTAVAAVPVLTGSTATVLQMGSGASGFAAGDVVVVDVDYAGATGYVGSGVSGAYVKSVLTDVDYVRRVSLNVARVVSVVAGAVTLDQALLAGVPVSGMKASVVEGFCDREGASFFQEWSALFVMDGQQGDRLVLHYPRLQAAASVREGVEASEGLSTLRLRASFRALPVRDAVDGETVVCFLSYLVG